MPALNPSSNQNDRLGLRVPGAELISPQGGHRDTDDVESPYLLIQRQFEDPDEHRCYIETHDKKHCGHFLLRRVDFTPQKLLIEFDRPGDNFVG